MQIEEEIKLRERFDAFLAEARKRRRERGEHRYYHEWDEIERNINNEAARLILAVEELLT